MTPLKTLTMATILLFTAAIAPAQATSIGWGNLQFPMSIAGSSCSGLLVFGQVWKAGVTDAPGQGAGITAQLGFGPVSSVPDNTWTWVAAVYNVDVGNNDEYMAPMTFFLAPGTYDFTYRYQFAGDGDWYVAAERGFATILEGCGTVDVQALAWGSLKAMYGDGSVR